jgi:hypothetical protein
VELHVTPTLSLPKRFVCLLSLISFPRSILSLLKRSLFEFFVVQRFFINEFALLINGFPSLLPKKTHFLRPLFLLAKAAVVKKSSHFSCGRVRCSTKKAENEILIKFFLPSDMEIFLVLLTIRKKQHFEPSKCICSNGNVFLFNFWFHSKANKAT